MDMPAWCGQCHKATRHQDTPQGPRRCKACHPLAAQRLGQFRTCPACLALIHDWDRRPCGNHEPTARAS